MWSRSQYGRQINNHVARHLRASLTTSASVVDTCPSPQFCCQASPQDLDIERKLSINNTIPAYTEQILISTGKADWASKIEDDDSGELYRDLRALLGPKGKYHDPSRNILLTHSSFRPSVSTKNSAQDNQTSAYLFPSFRYVSKLSSGDTVERFVQKLVGHSTNAKESSAAYAAQDEEVAEIMILICSHGMRDSRCGILGPILQQEFLTKLPHYGVSVAETSSHHETAMHEWTNTVKTDISAQVGLISHIGGHRWAGNVIMYVPPRLAQNALAGCGVWYGRVEPKHVEGLISETLKGNIVRELFRGGIDQRRQMIRV